MKTFVSPDNDWFRKFLFEDDHELYRTLVALVRTERFFPDSEQVIAYGLACAAVIFLLVMLTQFGRSHYVSASHDPDASRNWINTPSGEMPPQTYGWSIPSTGSELPLEPAAGSLVDDEQYTSGSVWARGGEASAGQQPATGAGGTLAQNAASTSSGGSGGHGDFRGVGPISHTAAPAKPAVTTVPDTGSSATILGAALAAVFAARVFLGRCREPRQS